MQFKYPEFLYALLLLIIPIIVHLFQLRRFEKVPFTNVKFLKKVELQTRKSSKLKKFLILLSRIGLLTGVILAFSQPYFSENKQNLKPQTTIYLDNSLSMQAKSDANGLFKNAVQDIITNYTTGHEVAVITNDDSYTKLDGKSLKNKLLSLDYHPNESNLKTVFLKVNKLNKQKKGIKNHLILISDFQENNIDFPLALDSLTDYSFVQLVPQKQENIAIENVKIIKQNGLDITLNVTLRSFGTVNESLPVSLYKDQILVQKTSVEIKKGKTSNAIFKLPFNDSFNGKIVIDDHLIEFDNTFYFTLNKVEKINVLTIGKDNTFLSKIYTGTEFNLLSKTVSQLDYNKINKQHLIVLNELEIIPLSLQKVLIAFANNGGSIAVIPSEKLNLANYNQFFNSLKMGVIDSGSKKTHQINFINFSHPILDNVFEKQVKNFQYPNVKSSYGASFKNATSVLKFDTQKAFISQSKVGKGKVYWLAGAINQQNSNFRNSPLIVPIFYNFGKQSFNIMELYYTIGSTNKIDIQTDILKDEVLHVNGNSIDFIPMQHVSQNKVYLTIDENPLKAGIYQVKKGVTNLRNIAFNYNKKESNIQYANMNDYLKGYENASYTNNIKATFEQINKKYQATSFWKWFVGLAILFWIIEMLLVKFMKG